MLWNPAYLTLTGNKPSAAAALPAIANPNFAIDTSVRSSLFSDLEGTVPAADGDPVARVNDLLGGLGYFHQPTAGARPILAAGIAGPYAGLRFDADGKWMRMAGLADPGSSIFKGKNQTYLMVFRRSSAGKVAGIFACGNSTGGVQNAGYDAVRIDGTSGGWPQYWRNSGSEIKSFPLTNPAYADNQITKFVVRSDISGLPVEVRAKSAVGSFTGSGSNPTNADTATWDVALLGSRIGTAGNYFPVNTFLGDIFEFRRWGSRASDANFAALQAYADLKWGS